MAGEEVADSTESDVAVEGMGRGIWVVRNIRYVWTEARMKREANGMTGRPSRRIRF